MLDDLIIAQEIEEKFRSMGAFSNGMLDHYGTYYFLGIGSVYELQVLYNGNDLFEPRGEEEYALVAQDGWEILDEQKGVHDFNNPLVACMRLTVRPNTSYDDPDYNVNINLDSPKNLEQLLVWIRDSFVYEMGQNSPEEALKNGLANCFAFSVLFQEALRVNGTKSEVITGFVPNIALFRFSYFSKATEAVVKHSLILTEGGKIIDPTIYNTTYHNSDIPSGMEQRALSPMIKHFIASYQSIPHLVLPNRDITELYHPDPIMEHIRQEAHFKEYGHENPVIKGRPNATSVILK